MTATDAAVVDDPDRWRARSAEGMAVAHWAEVAPDRAALVPTVDEHRSDARTYGELNERINQLVRALRARGLRDGDGVAVLIPNRTAFVEVYWACLRAGWRFTPINWHLGTDEVAYIVSDCGARAFVVDQQLAAIGEPAAAAVPTLDVRLLCAADPAGPGAGDLGLDGSPFEDYDDALAAQPGTDIEDPVPGVTMLYTSGTTGRPKGVHRERHATLVVDRAIYRPGAVHLLTGPLYHAAPLAITLHTALSSGSTLVLMETWDAERTLQLIEQHRVNYTHVVPTMFHRLLALPDDTKQRYDLSSLFVVVHGAAPCPVHVKQAMIDWWGPVIWEYYAATEGAGTLVDSITWQAHPGTVGRPNPEGQVLVGDEHANPLPPDQVGLVWLRAVGDERFRYHGDDEKTSSSFRGDYFTLGDLGSMDADGFLYLSDRSAHLIISGGVNIYPAEVDAVLLEHPAVADAATIGIPNDEWGEEVKAVVELHDVPAGIDAAEMERELIAFCRDHLAHFKCPRSIDFVAQLPRQDNGKIAKVRLRDEYRRAHEPVRPIPEPEPRGDHDRSTPA